MSTREWSRCACAAAFTVALSAASIALTHAQSGNADAKTTPRLDGRPDLNGTWDSGYNDLVIGFVQPTRLPGGSVCVAGCATAAGCSTHSAPTSA